MDVLFGDCVLSEGVFDQRAIPLTLHQLSRGGIHVSVLLDRVVIVVAHLVFNKGHALVPELRLLINGVDQGGLISRNITLEVEGNAFYFTFGNSLTWFVTRSARPVAVAG